MLQTNPLATPTLDMREAAALVQRALDRAPEIAFEDAPVLGAPEPLANLTGVHEGVVYRIVEDPGYGVYAACDAGDDRVQIYAGGDVRAARAYCRLHAMFRTRPGGVTFPADAARRAFPRPIGESFYDPARGYRLTYVHSPADFALQAPCGATIAHAALAATAALYAEAHAYGRRLEIDDGPAERPDAPHLSGAA